MKTFILTRHCTTDWNLEGRMQGHKDTDLAIIGVKEAHTLAENIRTLDIAVHSIISSDLRRARKTAQIVNTYLRVPFDHDVRLRECSFGELEGLTREEVEKKYGKKILADWDDNHKNYDFKKFGGESQKEVLARHLALLKELPPLPETKAILLVGHGRGLNTLLYGLGHPPTLGKTEYRIIEIKNP